MDVQLSHDADQSAAPLYADAPAQPHPRKGAQSPSEDVRTKARPATEQTSPGGGGESGQKARETRISRAALEPTGGDAGRAAHDEVVSHVIRGGAQIFTRSSLDEDQDDGAGENDQGVVQTGSENHGDCDHALIVALWRQRQDLARARQRLDLQCQAVCRRYVDGDKDKASKLWSAIKKGDGDDQIALVLSPYRLAMDPLEAAQKALEKQLSKLATAHPLWDAWAAGVAGIGPASFAGILGEAGRPIADYRSVSAVWKRFGLAVIDGGRQRRVSGDAAVEHGYSPQRRAYGYVVSGNLLKAQGKDEEAGPYRVIFDARKAAMLERGFTKGHAQSDAQRVMFKACLKDLWVAARRLEAL